MVCGGNKQSQLSTLREGVRNYSVKPLEVRQFLHKIGVTCRTPVVKVQGKHDYFRKKSSNCLDEFFKLAKPDFHDKIPPNQKGPPLRIWR